MKRGIATFTLDEGKCPPWLFRRMVALGRDIVRILIYEYGPDEFVKRMADPVWFQSLGTVLAFDWNASGLTTILTAALKEAIRREEWELGIFICGGKGKTSRRTPDEILEWGEKLGMSDKKTNALVYNSKMSAKVDSALVQDGFQIYHHSFIFSRNGAWTVVQQGMNTANQTARRYHWFSENVHDLVCEPHSGISSKFIGKNVLNMVSKNSSGSRGMSVDLVGGGYNALMKDVNIVRRHFSRYSNMISVRSGKEQLTLLDLDRGEFYDHPMVKEDFVMNKYLDKVLREVAYVNPENYEKMVALKGVGPKTVRALALVSEIIYGAKPSYEDPARYSFAHGGKDGTPFPVDTKTYDETIAILKRAVARTHWNPDEKRKAVNKLEKDREQ
ncbi:DUF763 domain-containing protein [Patescibacteria group bacterium]|nr:DUF763 domain-containing protein [Patescibacteria group bacterium]MCL5114446.1 DUF763 domain-containing protein [Patescibacteria group bacterium]